MKRKWFVFLLAFVMCTGQTMIFAESDTGQEEKVTGNVESIEQTDLENEAQIEPQKLKKEEIGGGGGRKNRNICSARKEKEKEDS